MCKLVCNKWVSGNVSLWEPTYVKLIWTFKTFPAHYRSTQTNMSTLYVKGTPHSYVVLVCTHQEVSWKKSPKCHLWFSAEDEIVSDFFSPFFPLFSSVLFWKTNNAWPCPQGDADLKRTSVTYLPQSSPAGSEKHGFDCLTTHQQCRFLWWLVFLLKIHANFALYSIIHYLSITMFLVIYHQAKSMIQENTPGLSVVSVCPHKISRTRAHQSSKDVTAGL